MANSEERAGGRQRVHRRLPWPSIHHRDTEAQRGSYFVVNWRGLADSGNRRGAETCSVRAPYRTSQSTTSRATDYADGHRFASPSLRACVASSLLLEYSPRRTEGHEGRGDWRGLAGIGGECEQRRRMRAATLSKPRPVRQGGPGRPEGSGLGRPSGSAPGQLRGAN